MILITMSAVVQAAPLTVVEVGAPAINCVYNTTCQIVVNDTIGSIPVPGVSGTHACSRANSPVRQVRREQGSMATCTESILRRRPAPAASARSNLTSVR
jgi:hypothetical protein